MTRWLRPSGTKIETNDRKETIAHCENIGWVRLDEQVSEVNTSENEVKNEEPVFDPGQAASKESPKTVKKPSSLRGKRASRR